jgi:hypothetical protein
LEHIAAEQLEDIKLKEMNIFDSKKKILDYEKKLKEQQVM